jgi:hypothetical protein
MLSDGKSTFSCTKISFFFELEKNEVFILILACILGTQMNKLIETNTLKENSIVRIDRVMVNAIDKQHGR